MVVQELIDILRTHDPEMEVVSSIPLGKRWTSTSSGVQECMVYANHDITNIELHYDPFLEKKFVIIVPTDQEDQEG